MDSQYAKVKQRKGAERLEVEECDIVRPRTAEIDEIIECYQASLGTPKPESMMAILEEAWRCLSKEEFICLSDGLVAAWICWQGEQILVQDSEELSASDN